jgi:hypothetical protein
MASASDDALPPAAEALLAYWSTNPDAMDSVQGIAQWWLMSSSGRLSMPEIERALNVLIERGLVVRRTLADGTEVYARQAMSPGAEE